MEKAWFFYLSFIKIVNKKQSLAILICCRTNIANCCKECSPSVITTATPNLSRLNYLPAVLGDLDLFALENGGKVSLTQTTRRMGTFGEFNLHSRLRNCFIIYSLQFPLK